MTGFEAFPGPENPSETPDNRPDSIVELDSVVVDIGTLCELFGFSEQYAGRLVGQGVLCRSARGRYPLAANVKGYVGLLRQRRALADGDEGVDNTYERAMLARSQREKIDVEVAERRRQLIPFAEAEAAYGEIVTQIRTKLLALPSRAAPLVAGGTAEGAVTALSSLVDEVLDSLSQAPDLSKPVGDDGNVL